MTRHKHGEGSVFQRKDKRWVAQITLENGKKKFLYRKTEKEANAALRKALNELEKGTLVTGKQQPLKAYLDQWLEQGHRYTVKVSTYYAYRTWLDRHIIPALGHVQLQRLTPEHIQAFYSSKLNEGLSEKTVRSFHMVLHMALDDAVKRGLIAKNVSDLVDRPKPRLYEITVLTPEQAKQLIKAASEYKLEAIITLALATGMRRGELLALRWQDIDFNTKSLHIRRTRNRIGKHGVVESEPKTAKSKRKITLPAFVVDVLLRQREHIKELRTKEDAAKWKETDAVFTNKYGDYMEAASLLFYFKELLKRAGLPHMRFHDLRHSAATILLVLGVHPKVVQELLGHTNISITLNTYSHVLPSMQQEAMDKLDGLYGKES